MGQNAIFWILIGIGAAAAGAFGFYYLRRPATLVRAIVKTSAVGAGALALMAVGAAPLALPLGLSAAGDFALAFDKKWTLPLGIFAFLLAQLIYFVAFFALWFVAEQQTPLALRIGLSAAVGLFVVCYLIWLWPKLGLLAFGVVPYALAIGAMTIMSFWIAAQGWPAMVGAVTFMVSDGVLAAEIFRLPPDAPARRFTSPIVWWTYVAAQALIIAGIFMALRVRF